MLDLWAAVGNAPDDDQLRLVVADAMEERGDLARAELVRVQVARKQADPYEAAGMDLRWRERVLLAREGSRWRAAMPRWEGAVLEGWDRGFPSWVRARDPAALARVLPELPPGVTGLRLSRLGEPGALQGLPPFARLALNPQALDGRLLELLDSPLVHEGLVELSLADQGLGDDDVMRLAWTASLRGLRSLDLRRNYLQEPSLAAIVASPHLSGLRSLRLGRAGDGIGFERLLLGADAANALLRWQAWPQLLHLDLSGQGLDADAVERLLSSPGSLQTLDLCESGLGGLSLPRGDGGMRLQRLVLRDAELRNEDLRALLSFPALRQLRSLDLARNPLGRGAADLLIEAPCWSEGPLRELCLEGTPLQRGTAAWARSSTGPLSLQLTKCGLDGGDLDTLARAPWWGALRELELLVNPVLAHAPGVPMGAAAQAVAQASHLRRLALGPDDGSWHTLPSGLVELRFSALSPALLGASLPDLVALDLSRTRLGDGLAELAAAPWLPTLTELDLQSCALRTLSPLALPERLELLRLSQNRLPHTELLPLLDRPLPDLAELWLDGTRSDALAGLLLDGAFPSLRRLRWFGPSGPGPRERELAHRFGWG